MLCVGVEASASSFPCRRTSDTACFFRPRALNAGRRHLSPARGPRSLPPSRSIHPRYRPVEFSAPPRLSRRLPLRPFPSATVRWPSTPFNFVRPAPQSPFTCCARFPLPPSVGLRRRSISCAPRLSCRLPVAPVSLCHRPLAFNAVQFRAPQSPFTCCARSPYLSPLGRCCRSVTCAPAPAMHDTQVVIAYLHVLFSVHLFWAGDFAASASHLS
jgi:hypothetical protein